VPILKADVPARQERHAGRFLFRGVGTQDPRPTSRAELASSAAWASCNASPTPACGPPANEIRYRGNATVELLTSIIPIRAADGCWVLTCDATRRSEFPQHLIGRPYWETRESASRRHLPVLAVIALPGRPQHSRQHYAAFATSPPEIRPGPYRRQCLHAPQVSGAKLSSVRGDFEQASARTQARLAQIRQKRRGQRRIPSDPVRHHPLRPRAGPSRRAARQRARQARPGDASHIRAGACSIWVNRRRNGSDISTAELIRRRARCRTDFSSSRLRRPALREILATEGNPLIRRLESAPSCAPATACSRRC